MSSSTETMHPPARQLADRRLAALRRAHRHLRASLGRPLLVTDRLSISAHRSVPPHSNLPVHVIERQSHVIHPSEQPTRSESYRR